MATTTVIILGIHALVYVLMASRILKVSFVEINGEPWVDYVFGSAPEFIKAFFRFPDLYLTVLSFLIYAVMLIIVEALIAGKRLVAKL